MTDQLSILKLVAERLDAAGIPYMITGSIAAGYYARPRMTRDIDLVVEVRPADAERLAGAFAPEFTCDVDAIRGAIARRSLFNLIHVEAVAKVDFIVRKDDPYQIEEFGRRRRVEIGGHLLWMVSPEDLILSKLEPHRHRSSARRARLTDTPPGRPGTLRRADAAALWERTRPDDERDVRPRQSPRALEPSFHPPRRDGGRPARAALRSSLRRRAGHGRAIAHPHAPASPRRTEHHIRLQADRPPK